MNDLFPSERVHPDDVIANGPTWRRERDEARASLVDIQEAAINVWFAFVALGEATNLWQTSACFKSLNEEMGRLAPLLPGYSEETGGIDLTDAEKALQ